MGTSLQPGTCVHVLYYSFGRIYHCSLPLRLTESVHGRPRSFGRCRIDCHFLLLTTLSGFLLASFLVLTASTSLLYFDTLQLEAVFFPSEEVLFYAYFIYLDISVTFLPFPKFASFIHHEISHSSSSPGLCDQCSHSLHHTLRRRREPRRRDLCPDAQGWGDSAHLPAHWR